MLKQKVNENHSKQMIIDEVECQRLDCRTLLNQVSDLRQQLLNEQNQNVYKLVCILNFLQGISLFCLLLVRTL